MALSCPLGAASLVSVSDNSVAEWDALPQAYVFEAVCPENASHKALKSVKVYADAQYINVLVEADRSYFDADEWVPLHMYIDTDNSDATGGYSDEFTDANADIILETAVFYEGQAYNYNPAVFKWWGEIGGSGWQWTDPEAEHGADDYWGAIVGESMLPVGASQMVDGRIEIQIDRFFIPAEWNNTGFGIGFDILHNWSAVGILSGGTTTGCGGLGILGIGMAGSIGICFQPSRIKMAYSSFAFFLNSSYFLWASSLNAVYPALCCCFHCS